MNLHGHLLPLKLQHSSEVSGGAAAIAEKATNFKYVHLYPAYQIQPIAVETCGTVQIFLKELEKRRPRMAYGEPKSYAFLLQRLSVAVQTGNTTSDTGSILFPLSTLTVFNVQFVAFILAIITIII